MAPPLVLYSVDATPDGVSPGENVAVTAVLLQPAGTSAIVVTGAVLSMLTVRVLTVSTLPAASVERYS